MSCLIDGKDPFAEQRQYVGKVEDRDITVTSKALSSIKNQIVSPNMRDIILKKIVASGIMRSMEFGQHVCLCFLTEL